MIDKKLRRMIEPYLLMVLPKKEHEWVDYMFGECYLTNDEKGREVVVVRPYPNCPNITFMFSAINGAYIHECINWPKVQAEGKLL